MDRSKYAEQFWHCHISMNVEGERSIQEAYATDMNISQLDEQIVTPWLSGRKFAVDGLLVRQKESINVIKIIHTKYNSHYYYETNEAIRSGFVVQGFTSGTAPFDRRNHNDYTNEILFSSVVIEVESKIISAQGIKLLARSYVRKLLKNMFKTSSQFDAFCMDYFPNVHEQFASGMDSTEKMNILLLEDLNSIYEIVKKEHPADVEEYENKQ